MSREEIMPFRLKDSLKSACEWANEISEHPIHVYASIVAILTTICVDCFVTHSSSTLFDFSVEKTIYTLFFLLEISKYFESPGSFGERVQFSLSRYRGLLLIAIWSFANYILLIKENWFNIDSCILSFLIVVHFEFYFRTLIILSLFVLLFIVALVDKFYEKISDWRFQKFYRSTLDLTTTCPICILDATDMILPCGHKYHRDCIRAWNQYSLSCPTCKRTLF